MLLNQSKLMISTIDVPSLFGGRIIIFEGLPLLERWWTHCLQSALIPDIKELSQHAFQEATSSMRHSYPPTEPFWVKNWNGQLLLTSWQCRKKPSFHSDWWKCFEGGIAMSNTFSSWFSLKMKANCRQGQIPKRKDGVPIRKATSMIYYFKKNWDSQR